MIEKNFKYNIIIYQLLSAAIFRDNPAHPVSFISKHGYACQIEISLFRNRDISISKIEISLISVEISLFLIEISLFLIEISLFK